MLYDLLLSDMAEIIIFSSCIFALCKWLKIDRTKNLLGYFFTYSTLTLCAWTLQLPTVTLFLCTYAPIALLLFIVLHEKTLQRNLVTLCTITPTQNICQDWLDTLISSCLSSINSNKSISIVLEHKNALDHFLTAPFLLNADISKNIFDILLSSASYDEQKMIWIQSSGKIRGINVSWIVHQENKDDTLFYTLHSDAIVLSAHPIDRAFTLTVNGKETKNILAHQVHNAIKRQLSLSLKQKGAYRESTTSEKSLSI